MNKPTSCQSELQGKVPCDGKVVVRVRVGPSDGSMVETLALCHACYMFYRSEGLVRGGE